MTGMGLTPGQAKAHRVLNHTTVSVPAHIGGLTAVFVMEGVRFGFHPVVPSTSHLAKNWVRK